MRDLSFSDLVSIWEHGFSRHAVDRSLLILHYAMPGKSPEELAMLSIGERDRYLLAVREQLFGSQLECTATCPQCDESLAFTLETTAICKNRNILNNAAELELEKFGYRLRFRLPNSMDLAQAAAAGNEPEARKRLLQRCILRAERGEKPVSPSRLPERVRNALAQEIKKRDPLAEIILSLHCPACEHQWKTLFDMALYFWEELAALVQRLLQEVHVLASAYGWHEADILAMSAVRRHYYLQMVS